MKEIYLKTTLDFIYTTDPDRLEEIIASSQKELKKTETSGIEYLVVENNTENSL